MHILDSFLFLTTHCFFIDNLNVIIAQLAQTTHVNKNTRHYATNGKVAGSIPDGVSGIFHRHNSSGRTMAPGLTQSLTELSTRDISWRVKSAGT